MTQADAKFWADYVRYGGRLPPGLAKELAEYTISPPQDEWCRAQCTTAACQPLESVGCAYRRWREAEGWLSKRQAEERAAGIPEDGIIVSGPLEKGYNRSF